MTIDKDIYEHLIKEGKCLLHYEQVKNYVCSVWGYFIVFVVVCYKHCAAFRVTPSQEVSVQSGLESFLKRIHFELKLSLMHQTEFLKLEFMFYFYGESQTALGNMVQNASENRKNGSHTNSHLPFPNNLFGLGAYALFNNFLLS